MPTLQRTWCSGVSKSLEVMIINIKIVIRILGSRCIFQKKKYSKELYSGVLF